MSKLRKIIKMFSKVIYGYAAVIAGFCQLPSFKGNK